MKYTMYIMNSISKVTLLFWGRFIGGGLQASAGSQEGAAGSEVDVKNRPHNLGGGWE